MRTANAKRKWERDKGAERGDRNWKYNKIIIIKVKNPFYTPNNAPAGGQSTEDRGQRAKATENEVEIETRHNKHGAHVRRTKQWRPAQRGRQGGSKQRRRQTNESCETNCTRHSQRSSFTPPPTSTVHPVSFVGLDVMIIIIGAHTAVKSYSTKGQETKSEAASTQNCMGP